MRRFSIMWINLTVASSLLLGCVAKQESEPQVNIISENEEFGPGSIAEIRDFRDSVAALEEQVNRVVQSAQETQHSIPQESWTAVQQATRLEEIAEPQTPPAPIEPLRLEPQSSTISAEARDILMQALVAQQTRMSVIANNLANADTIAFKRSRVIFETQAYRHQTLPGDLDSSGNTTAVGVSIGLGCRVSGVRVDFSQGVLETTNNPLDLAIVGRGFFQVTDPTGETLYTRAGNFSINANNQLVLGSASTGRLLEPQITIPQDYTEIVINPSGEVLIQQPGAPQLTSAGMLQLATFVNPQGLLNRGENLYAQTDASGVPIIENPGQNGAGSLRQNALENSNVDPLQEMFAWRQTQRQLSMLQSLLGVDDVEALSRISPPVSLRLYDIVMVSFSAGSPKDESQEDLFAAHVVAIRPNGFLAIEGATSVSNGEETIETSFTGIAHPDDFVLTGRDRLGGAVYTIHDENLYDLTVRVQETPPTTPRQTFLDHFLNFFGFEPQTPYATSDMDSSRNERLVSDLPVRERALRAARRRQRNPDSRFLGEFEWRRFDRH